MKKAAFILVTLISALLILNACTSAPVYSGARSAHYDGSTFKNSIPSDKNPWDIIKLFSGFYILKDDWPSWVEPEIEPENPVERSEQLRVTFINHSTVLIQVGLNNEEFVALKFGETVVLN